MRASGGLEVADIFRRYGPAYRESHRLSRNDWRVMRAIEACRTAILGGHKDKCDNCGHLEISYNSCRNRHCPKCQTLKKERWIEARSQDLLPIQYFQVVFTITSELNRLVSMNRKVMYDLLFRSVSETLMELANDQKHLGAMIGAIGILHTWGQNLLVALKKSRKWRRWRPAIWAYGKGIPYRHLFKEQISILLPKQSINERCNFPG